MPANDEYVIELLKDVGLLTPEQVEDASSKSGGINILEELLREGVVTPENIAKTLASQNGMDFIDLAQVTPLPDVVELIPHDIARRYRTVPVAERDGTLVLAIADPMDFEAFDSIGFILKRPVEFVCAVPELIIEKLEILYPQGLQGSGQVSTDEEEFDSEDEAPIIKLVSSLLVEAQNNRASDIHIEPLEKTLRVRFRIDGNLQEVQSPPKKLQGAIVSRLKIMSGSMSIAEKRVPQDGRIQMKVGDKMVDLRVSTVPTVHGESVVMRVLDKSALMLGLPELGFLSDDQALFQRLAQSPDGIILVTGPTGSGKTTTLYACLNRINTIDSKLLTAEDPVEYEIDGIMQVPINDSIGMTFARVLRAFLRQDPDRIMIGETRDLETATIAIQASLTGHLVFTTLHTNDATGAVSRLVDMGVEPFMISASLEGVLAQRLVRRICTSCKTAYEPDESVLGQLGLSPYDVGDKTFYFGKGCAECNNTGYKGRKGLYELLKVSDPVRILINDRAPNVVLRQKAIELGMRTIREDGIRCIFDGVTTIEEVLKYT